MSTFRMSALIVILAAIVVASLSYDLSAQKNENIYPGARIRLLAPPKITERITGRVSAVKPDTLVLFARGSNVPLIVPFSSITELEVTKYRKSMAKPGAIVGAVVGGLALTIVGLSEFEDDCPNKCPPEDWPPGLHFDCSDYSCFGFSRPAKIFIGAFAFTWLGGGAGFLVGNLIKSERWETIPTEQLKIGFRMNHQKNLLLSVSFNL